MRTKCVLTVAVLGFIASGAWGGAGPVPEAEVEALIANYRQRMAASEAPAPDVSDRETGCFADVPWLDVFGGRECPRFSVVDPALIAEGT